MRRLAIIAVVAMTTLSYGGAIAVADDGSTTDPAPVTVEEPLSPDPGGEDSTQAPTMTDAIDPPSEVPPEEATPEAASDPSPAIATALPDDVAPLEGRSSSEEADGVEEGGCLKLACRFQLAFSSFPEGDLSAAYRIELWHPSGEGLLEAGTVAVGEDPAGGAGDLDAFITIDLTQALLDAGAQPRPNGFHVRLTVDLPVEGIVTIDDHRLARGHGGEADGHGAVSKVFWVDCPDLPQPPGDDDCVKLQTCLVRIRFAGFPEGDLAAAWTIVLWHPSGAGELASGTVGVGDDPAGGETDTDAVVKVDLADPLRTSGATRGANGFHVRLIVTVPVEGWVTVAGSPLESHEGDEHHGDQFRLMKTFWIDCDPTEPTPEPVPAPEPTPEPSPDPDTSVLGVTDRFSGGTAFTGGGIGAGPMAVLLGIVGLLSLAIARRPSPAGPVGRRRS